MTAPPVRRLPPPPVQSTRAQRLMLISSLGVGTFTTALSNSVLNAILPLIADAFATDISAVEWIVTAFLLVQSGLLLTFGRLGDMIGHRKVYLTGLAVFIISLALCAFSPTLTILLAARVFQAIGSAMFIANSPPILTAFFPPSMRGQVLGIQATTVYLGLAAGAPIGGFLAGAFGWQSVFLVPIPFAAIAFTMSTLVLRKDILSARKERFDLVGAAIYLVGLILLLLALNRGRSWGWTSELTLGCLAAGLVALVTFVIHERRTPSPMLDLSLFKHRAFISPVISSMMNYSASAGTTFLLPFALIQGRNLSPGEVGLVLTSQPIVMAIMATLSGGLSDRIGSRIPATVGMAILSLGLFVLAQMQLDTPLWALSVILAVVGLGIGLFTSPNNSSVLGAVGAERRGVASGILSTARTLGNVLGIGLAGAVYATSLLYSGSRGPTEVVTATSWGMLVASGLAAIGAASSFVRPSQSRLTE